jgi:hypothetical protein
MSKWRILGRVLGVIVICIGLFYLWFDYSFRRSFRHAFGPQFSADIHDLSVAFKGQMGALYLGKKSDLPTLVDGRTFPDKANQLLAAYRSNPEKYIKYAKFSDTVLSASQVGDELLKTPPPTRLPSTSDELSSMRSDLRRDSWGHPFCIVSTDKLAFVVSLGPEVHAPFTCHTLHIDNEIRKSERRIFQTPSGEVVLKIDRSAATPSLSQALSSLPSTRD